MTATYSQLLPEHDVYPDALRARRVTLVGYATACLAMAVFAWPAGADTLALVAASGALFARAWLARESGRRETGKDKPRD